jgi:hypothetical protein
MGEGEIVNEAGRVIDIGLAPGFGLFTLNP